jgi:peptidoglycan hydrolase-like protein with peptidoglycan-binding domain
MGSLIQGSVGAGAHAAKSEVDVRSVQHLFNLAGGGANLEEDGRCGPKTVGRIRQFQRDVLRYPRPDGRVDPSGRTLAVLLARASQRSRARRPAANQDESWMEWAGKQLASLQHAMSGAYRSLFGDRARATRVRSASAGGRAAAGSGGPAPAAAGGARNGVTDRDYAAAAAKLGPNIDPLLVKAVAHVESNGNSGFGPDGRPVIAYEGHRFRRYTRNIYDQSHPLLSYEYKKKAGWQWQRNNKDHTTAWRTLTAAMELNAEAALKATSWGMCQVMEFTYASCGYANVFAFVEAMKRGSLGQLEAFVGYCKNRSGMVSALQRKDFAAMAYAYNGEDYGDYDVKFRKAYKRLGGQV